MGIYDRDYYRGDQRSFSFRGPSTMIGTLILINVVLYVANAILGEPPQFELGRLSSFLAVHVETLLQPLFWWRFLTYGFVHAYQPQHVIMNMLTLWFLGQDVERTYGRNEFLRFYLVALVVGSAAWAVANRLMGVAVSGPLVGASGAVTAVVILFALLFPARTLLLFFVLPVPAWFVGLLVVGWDIYTGLHGGTEIAWGVHLAGAAFAFAYYRFKWNFGRLLPDRFSLGWLQSPSRLRVVDPDEDEDDDDRLNEEVDRILAKISREGETEPVPQRTPHSPERQPRIPAPPAELGLGSILARIIHGLAWFNASTVRVTILPSQTYRASNSTPCRMNNCRMTSPHLFASKTSSSKPNIYALSAAGWRRGFPPSVGVRRQKARDCPAKPAGW